MPLLLLSMSRNLTGLKNGIKTGFYSLTNMDKAVFVTQTHRGLLDRNLSDDSYFVAGFTAVYLTTIVAGTYGILYASELARHLLLP